MSERRISSVDTLRGFALLGILPVNIVAFGLPLAAYVTPVNAAVNVYRGPFEGAGALSWLATHVVCDLKMMTIFSMLFGASLVLMDANDSRRRAHSGGPSGPFARRYYRRLAILAVFGIVHGLVVWYGDILFYYALSGVALYPLRKWRPSRLMGLGLVLFVVQVGGNRWEGGNVAEIHAAPLRAEAGAAGARAPSEADEEAIDEWRSVEEDHDPTPDQVAFEISQVRGSAASAMHRNTELVLYNWTSSELVFWCWRALTAMLIGMGLMKLRVFAAERSRWFYAALLGAGWGVGLPIVAIGLIQLQRHSFEPVYLERVGSQYNFVGSLFVAVGHIGLVMLACQKRWLLPLTRRLAAVGQMALTNYLAQSLVCVAVFSGWGLGLFARFTQAELFVCVAAIWGIELAWSPWWLSRFRYGPAEWLWRSGTYATWETMSRTSP